MRFHELKNASGFQKCMRPVHVLQSTASPIEMRLAFKVSQYLIIPVEVFRFGISGVMPALGLINA